RRIGQCGAALRSAAISPLLPIPGVVEILAEQPEVGIDLPGIIKQRGWRNGVRTDGRPAGTEDMRFFPTYFFSGIAQILRMVNVHTGDNGAIGIHEVDRVKPPAQAHFHNGDIYALFAEKHQRSQGGVFKVAERCITACVLNDVELLNDGAVASRLAIEAYSFVEVDQMGR